MQGKASATRHCANMCSQTEKHLCWQIATSLSACSRCEANFRRSPFIATACITVPGSLRSGMQLVVQLTSSYDRNCFKTSLCHPGDHFLHAGKPMSSLRLPGSVAVLEDTPPSCASIDFVVRSQAVQPLCPDAALRWRTLIHCICTRVVKSLPSSMVRNPATAKHLHRAAMPRAVPRIQDGPTETTAAGHFCQRLSGLQDKIAIFSKLVDCVAQS